MRIISAASALPPHYYPQDVLIEAFRKYWGSRLEKVSTCWKRLHAATQVDGRYLAFAADVLSAEGLGAKAK